MRVRLYLLLGLALCIFYLGIGVSFSQNIQYLYDDLNRLIKTEYDDGITVEYTYDEVGNRLFKGEVVINNPPTAGSDSYVVDEGGSLSQSAPGVLANDTDMEGDSLTAVLLTSTSHGTLSLNPDGSFIYVHNSSEATSDTFTYKINDGTGDSNLAVVSITINALNDGPQAIDNAYSINRGGTLNQPVAKGVLANDSDAEEDSFTAILVSDVSHGKLTFNPDGSFIYVNDGSLAVSDSFTYKANDGVKDGNIAVVILNIKAVVFFEQAGWPVVVDSGAFFFSSSTIGDIDGDGDMEIVIGGRNNVYAFHHNSTLVSGWPVAMEFMVASSPALGDIDGDGDMEIVVTADSSIYVFHHNGTLVSGWPVLDVYMRSSPALGDIDGDGDMEVVVGTMYGEVYAFHHDGSIVSGWPVEEVGWFVSASPSLGDIDGDNDIEIVVGAETNSDNTYAFHYDGTLVSGWPVITDKYVWSSPSLGDLDGDGDLEVVVGSHDNKIYALHHDGIPVSGWPVTTDRYVMSSPALGDIDGDGDIEVVIGSTDNNIYAFHHNGTLVSGWPFTTKGPVNSSPALGDLDGDGDIEIVVASGDGKIYCIDSSAAYDPANIEWQMFRHDAMHTGVYSLLSVPFANAGGFYVAEEGIPITFDGSSSSDPNGDVLRYRWDFNNDGVYDIDWSDVPIAIYTWEDDYSGIVKLEVSDGKEQAVDTASVTVNNAPPAITSIPSTETYEERLYNYLVVCVDPGEGDTVTYSLEVRPSGMSIDLETGLILWTPVFGQAGQSHDVKVVAQDDDGASSSQKFDVEVIRINHPPLLQWTADAGYVNDALEPETGDRETDFVFRVKYVDIDGNAPAVYQLYLDKNGDNDYDDSEEVVQMQPLGSDYAGGVIYTYITKIPYSGNSQNCFYYFKFSDGENLACGAITGAISKETAVNKPDISQTVSVSIDKTLWQLPQIPVGSQYVTDAAQKIRVTNNGDGSQTYSLKIVDQGEWSASSDKSGAGINTFVLSGIFTEELETSVRVDYFNEAGSDDVIPTGSFVKADASRFASGKTLQNGSAVAAGETRNLWLEFEAPRKDTKGGVQSIKFNVTAEIP